MKIAYENLQKKIVLTVSPHSIVGQSTQGTLNQYYIGIFLAYRRFCLCLISAYYMLNFGQFSTATVIVTSLNTAKPCGFGLNGRFVDRVLCPLQELTILLTSQRTAEFLAPLLSWGCACYSIYHNRWVVKQWDRMEWFGFYNFCQNTKITIVMCDYLN